MRPDARRPALNFRGTPSYQAPEILLGRLKAERSFASDVWGVGCIMYEAITGVPPFCGSSSMELLGVIFCRLGTTFPSFPTHTTNSVLFQGLGVSPTCVDLLSRMLELDEHLRINASDALAHPFMCEAAGGGTTKPNEPQLLLRAHRKAWDASELVFSSPHCSRRQQREWVQHQREHAVQERPRRHYSKEKSSQGLGDARGAADDAQ